jgi:hypothetical protein
VCSLFVLFVCSFPSRPGKSAKRAFALDFPATHIFPAAKMWMPGTKAEHDERCYGRGFSKNRGCSV